MSIRNVIRLTYLLFYSEMNRNKVLLFPNFQRSFCFTKHPFFERECKGKSRIISTKFFAIYFSIKFEFFGVKINLFCEELASFF
jgi:hypothetical protein